MKSLMLAVLPLIVIGCGGGKSKTQEHDMPMDLPVHKAEQCPNLKGKYKGKAQNETLLYEFVKVGNAFVANVSVVGMNAAPAAIPINGQAHKTAVGKTAMGCENGKINSVSIVNHQLNKAQLEPNDNGFRLNEELPQSADSQFYKLVD